MKLLTSSETLHRAINQLGIYTSEQLIDYLPYRYESYQYTNEYEMKDHDRIVIIGKLVSNPKLVHVGHFDMITFHFISHSEKLYVCKIFNRSYLMKILNYQDEFTLIGTYSEEKHELNIINLKKGEIPVEERLKAIYHLPSNIQSSVFSHLMKRTIQSLDGFIHEELPYYLVDKYHLLSHASMIKTLHFPKSNQEVILALRTAKFAECMSYCFKNKLIRDENKKLVKEQVEKIEGKKINDFIIHSFFHLSKSQSQSIREIILDMNQLSTMYRLLQGDVGTGKTLVALICLYANYLRHKQGVLMVPTDSLAHQHYLNSLNLFKDYPISIRLLVGSLSEKEKRNIQEELLSGKIDILIGTHAVFGKDYLYQDLGLAIIDEQHRFGVNQRNMLENKGKNVDLLLMSATPIPRTLSLSIYGDLDVSTLNEFPHGKREVKTRVVDFNSDKITGLIDYCLQNKEQVFLVCPKITSSLCNQNASVQAIYKKYALIYGDKIAMLHGKMKNDEKLSLLNQFSKGEIKILVATSIIELGIDIQNATGIIIFSANSFGLASLHQLRGRVGRSGKKAFCLLVDHFDDEKDSSRLKFMETCSDGFAISEEDMKLRGPGDFIGIEQSGFPSFNCLNIVDDFKMFEIARNEVSFICQHLDDSENQRYFQLNQERTKQITPDIKLFD